jgi:hypothetical protein
MDQSARGHRSQTRQPKSPRRIADLNTSKASSSALDQLGAPASSRILLVHFVSGDAPAHESCWRTCTLAPVCRLIKSEERAARASGRDPRNRSERLSHSPDP